MSVGANACYCLGGISTNRWQRLSSVIVNKLFVFLLCIYPELNFTLQRPLETEGIVLKKYFLLFPSSEDLSVDISNLGNC